MMRYSKWSSISSYLMEDLKNRIVSGEFAPEEKLPSEKILMEQYSVGRSSIREALRMLQAQNLIRIEQGRGSFVLSGKMQREEMRRWYKSQAETFFDLVELRKALEVTAVRGAILIITPEDIERLTGINTVFSDPNNANNYMLLQRYDEMFHRTIVHAAKMELLESMYDLFEDAYAEYRVKGFVFTNYIRIAGQGHAKVIEALKERNLEKTETELCIHIGRVVKEIEAILQISEDSNYE